MAFGLPYDVLFSIDLQNRAAQKNCGYKTEFLVKV